MNRHTWIALLGRRDEPTDALEDYCRHLAQALAHKSIQMELVRFPWIEQGWRGANKVTDRRIADIRPEWVLLQYTALSWSRRAFPIRFVGLIRHLKRSGVKVAVIFHEPLTFAGDRVRNRIRQRIQLHTMTQSAHLADRIVTTISPERVPWMSDPAIRSKISLIAVGSHVPETKVKTKKRNRECPVIAVFGITGGRRDEAMLIARVVIRVAERFGRARLIAMGRGVQESEATLREALEGKPVDLQAHGVLEPEQITALLIQADVQLFVRTGLTSNRTTAIAGITCGLPIVAFTSSETAYPITEAGVRLAPLDNAEALMQEMLTVLSDDLLYETLCRRSREATEQHFSWARIGEQYVAAFE